MSILKATTFVTPNNNQQLFKYNLIIIVAVLSSIRMYQYGNIYEKSQYYILLYIIHRAKIKTIFFPFPVLLQPEKKII